jgi:hypothetical protein
MNPGTKARGTTTSQTTVEIARNNIVNKPAPNGKISRDVVNREKQATISPKPVKLPTIKWCALAGAKSLLSFIDISLTR